MATFFTFLPTFSRDPPWFTKPIPRMSTGSVTLGDISHSPWLFLIEMGKVHQIQHKHTPRPKTGFQNNFFADVKKIASRGSKGIKGPNSDVFTCF